MFDVTCSTYLFLRESPMKITKRLVWVIRQRMDIPIQYMHKIDVLFLHGRVTIMSKKIVRVYIGYSFFDGLEDSIY